MNEDNIRKLWVRCKQLKEQVRVYDEVLSRTIDALIEAWEENAKLRKSAEPTEAELSAFWHNIQRMERPVYENWDEEVQHDD